MRVSVRFHFVELQDVVHRFVEDCVLVAPLGEEGGDARLQFGGCKRVRSDGGRNIEVCDVPG